MTPENAINAVIDKHPLSTGTLFLIVIAAIFIVYGVIYFILRKK